MLPEKLGRYHDPIKNRGQGRNRVNIIHDQILLLQEVFAKRSRSFWSKQVPNLGVFNHKLPRKINPIPLSIRVYA